MGIPMLKDKTDVRTSYLLGIPIPGYGDSHVKGLRRALGRLYLLTSESSYKIPEKTILYIETTPSKCWNVLEKLQSEMIVKYVTI